MTLRAFLMSTTSPVALTRAWLASIGAEQARKAAAEREKPHGNA